MNILRKEILEQGLIGRKNMKSVPVYRYECQECVIHFMVEQAYEHHSEITCPVCHGNDIEDLGEGEVRY
jgi:predicted nucleic acid-binding Zn ribbon protein